MKSPSRSFPIVRWRDDQRESGDDDVTVEEPLEIRVNGAAVAVTMRTPGDDEELAAGFCLTEGIVASGDEIVSVEFCGDATTDNVVDVRLDDGGDTAARDAAVERARRAGYLSSSCGICGKQSLDRIEQVAQPFPPRSFTVSPRRLAALPDEMRQRQTVFAHTGGLHSAALFGAGDSLVVLREDVGRHNAVDKVVGCCLLRHAGRGGAVAERGRSLLLVSGRASFEILQKAAVAGIPFVAAVGAPSSLAVDLAQRLDMTLVGFLRDGRGNVYSGAQRIAD